MEQSFEFYPYMLDPATVKIGSSGKYLNVEVSVKGKESFVKVFKEGKQQAFDDGIEIMAFDAKQAQDIAEAIKYLASNSKPKDKVWGDKQSAIKVYHGKCWRHEKRRKRGKAKDRAHQ